MVDVAGGAALDSSALSQSHAEALGDRTAFWLINGGLLAMVLLSVLPVGLLQTRASVEVGYWHTRSAESLRVS